MYNLSVCTTLLYTLLNVAFSSAKVEIYFCYKVSDKFKND